MDPALSRLGEFLAPLLELTSPNLDTPPYLQRKDSFLPHSGQSVHALCIGKRSAGIYATSGDDRHVRLWAVGGGENCCMVG